MFYLAHFSDIHLMPMPKISMTAMLDKRLIGYLNWRGNRSSHHDRFCLDKLVSHMCAQKQRHIVVSGDLVNLALPQEFANARLWLEGLGEPHAVSLCFGNHDAYVAGAYTQACKVFAPWLISNGFDDLTSAYPFPCLKLCGDIAIINVSSAIATPPFIAAGYVDKRQLQYLKVILEACAKQNLFRVINIHHPPIKGATSLFKSLWGMQAFQNILLAHGAELILHGHTHRATLNYLGGIPVVGVCSASQSSEYIEKAANYNSFAIGRGGSGEWSCALTRYSFIRQGDTFETRPWETIQII